MKPTLVGGRPSTTVHFMTIEFRPPAERVKPVRSSPWTDPDSLHKVVWHEDKAHHSDLVSGREDCGGDE